MRKPLLAGARRLGASASIAAALAALTAGSAIAAGSGYGPAAPTNSLQPSGFTAVVIARTVGNNGGTLHGGGVGGLVLVHVPPGAAGKSLQVAITHGSNSTVRHDLHGALSHDQIVGTFGVDLRHGSSPASTSKPVTVWFEAAHLHSGAVVVAYNPKTGKFARVKASFVFKAVRTIVTTKSSDWIAVLQPKK